MANRLDSRFNVRNDVFDSITPNNIRQRDIAAPAGEWKPAAWLPIQWSQSNIGAGADYFVCSSGKLVALTRQAEVVPAGLRSSLASSGITYGSDDVAQGVIDLTTGERVTAAVAYTPAQTALGILERGLVPAESFTGFAAFDYSVDTLSGGQITEIVEALVSKAVGIAAYDIYTFAGQLESGDDPYFSNYSKQHLVQMLTEAEMIVPHRVASSTAADAVNFGTVVVTTAPEGPGDMVAAGEIWNATALSGLERYDGVITATSSVVAVGLSEPDVARNTDRTPITSDVSGVLTSEKSSIAAISAEGDWYLDRTLGILILHSDTYTTLNGGATIVTLSYSYYDDAAAGAGAHRYIHFDGEAKPGDYVGYDEQSNFVPLGSAADISGGTAGDAVGRLHFALTEPRSLLGIVKTAFNLSNMNDAGKMPGTATKGFSDMITLSQETVADQVAVLLVRI